MLFLELVFLAFLENWPLLEGDFGFDLSSRVVLIFFAKKPHLEGVFDFRDFEHDFSGGLS